MLGGQQRVRVRGALLSVEPSDSFEAPRTFLWGGPRRWLSVVLVGLLVLLLGLRRFAWAPDTEMAPSVLRGDLLLLLPLTPEVGDVVVLSDPLEPARHTLRRVIAGPGATVRFEDAGFVVGDDAPSRLEMGREDGKVIVQVSGHLVQIRSTGTRWEMAPVAIGPEQYFLGADALDEATDSRWWGPVPSEAIAGVVAMRVGEPQHRWRDWVEFRK